MELMWEVLLREREWGGGVLGTEAVEEERERPADTQRDTERKRRGGRRGGNRLSFAF